MSIPSSKVTHGGASSIVPQSTGSQNGNGGAGDASMPSRARWWPTIAASVNRPLPKVWSPWKWVLTSTRTARG